MNYVTARVALVTGGARGIGAAIVERLARDGVKVAFTYTAAHEAADALVARLTDSGSDVVAIRADSAAKGAVAEAIDQTVARHGRLDILVNNAGVVALSPLHEQASDEIEAIIDVNIRAVVLGSRHAIPLLAEGGRIINIGSVNADRSPFPGLSVYAMTKGAVASLTHGLARELGPRGITVNNVQPGPIDTTMNPSDGPYGDLMAGQTALGRYGHVTDVAGLVAYLAGDEGKFITGASITIDGGFSV